VSGVAFARRVRVYVMPLYKLFADSESMEYVAHRIAAVRFYYGTEFFIFMWFPACKTILGWIRRFVKQVYV
jgi:hypothetical protein